VPAIVAYELRYGLERLSPAAARPRRQVLESLLGSLWVAPFDDECALRAAEIRAALERQGNGIGPHDILIAATALRYGTPLVTRDVREFGRVAGLTVIDWHADADADAGRAEDTPAG
jgi:tRNA(fMet)-specific endonuclease VapC